MSMEALILTYLTLAVLFAMAAIAFVLVDTLTESCTAQRRRANRSPRETGAPSDASPKKGKRVD